MENLDLVAGKLDPILVTGSSGFLGSRVVKILLDYGFYNLRCFVRPSSNLRSLMRVIASYENANVEIIEGNLLRPEDCHKAANGSFVIYHLAAGRGEKSYPDALLNSAVTTRNLLEASLANKNLKRFLSVSSFAVYSTRTIKHNGLLDENCPLEKNPEKRGNAYCYAKVKQDEIVIDYGHKLNIPYVIVRPGVIFGPGNKGITGRVGTGTFGIFIHLGGANIIPFTYVDNCAEAIVLAGLKRGIDGQILNIIDDDLPTSRKFLKLYKLNVRRFRSIYLPRFLSYLLCYLWETYSDWSGGQLPPVYNRNVWASAWKGNTYSNHKLRDLTGWKPKIGMDEALRYYFKFEKSQGAK